MENMNYLVLKSVCVCVGEGEGGVGVKLAPFQHCGIRAK